jgi:hypothetical protein
MSSPYAPSPTGTQTARPARLASARVTTVRRAGPLLAALTLGCGGDGGTGPDATPNVAGRYQRNDVIPAVTCTPQRPPAGGGTVILEAFSDSARVRVQQAGARLTITYPDFPGTLPDTGSVAADGTVTFGYRETFREEPREGNRTFFVDLTGGVTLRRSDNGARLAGSATYVNVFREGAATAPVFATCSRTATVVLTRLGD